MRMAAEETSPIEPEAGDVVDWFDQHVAKLRALLDEPWQGHESMRFWLGRFEWDGHTVIMKLSRSFQQNHRKFVVCGRESYGQLEGDLLTAEECVAFAGIDDIDPDLLVWRRWFATAAEERQWMREQEGRSGLAVYRDKFPNTLHTEQNGHGPM